MDLEGLVDGATLQRLRRVEAGEDVSRPIRLAAAEPGDVGVLRAQVVHTQEARTFRRRNGTEGLIARVRLADGTGEADLVLWDDETHRLQDLSPGASIVLRGVQVRAGYRAGIELSLGAATLEIAQETRERLQGAVVEIADTLVVEGRFQAEVTLATAAGQAQVVLWDEAVKQVRGLGIGAHVVIDGVSPHPMLDGCYLADGATVRAATNTTVVAKSQPPTMSDG